MKRFIIAITAIAFITTSCSPKNDDDLIASGLALYNAAETQQQYAFDFFKSAMLFNILMTEAKTQGISNFDDVKVTINENQYGLKNYLFGAGVTISSTDSIMYDITFQNSEYESRSGILTINTAGKTIDELTENDVWHISPKLFPFKFISSKYTIYVQSAEMYITPSAPRSWNVTMDSFQCYFAEEVVSDWDLNMNITQLDKISLRYKDYFSSRFEHRGGSSGKTLSEEVMYYTIDAQNPIVVLPSCGFNFFSAGNINVRIDESTPIDESRFPSREVDIKRQYAGNCVTDITVVYNGKTEKI